MNLNLMILEFKMNLLIFALLPITFACPYLKFSPDHTYCKPRNPQCKIFDAGFNKREKELVVKLHNQFRSKIAQGKERRAGGMPPAANMLEMVWDEELAAIAQKWTEQCKRGHDCYDCRRVDRYSIVGQNGFRSGTFPPYNRKKKEDLIRTGIKGFYNEVKDFRKKWVRKNPKGDPNGKVIGHFTQVVWAETLLVGCGKVFWKEDGEEADVFALYCNYAPGGNYPGAAVYKPGKPCSACPKNTCCDGGCKKKGIKANYKGLCKKVKKSKRRGGFQLANPSYDYGY